MRALDAEQQKTLERIEADAGAASNIYDHFRRYQITPDGDFDSILKQQIKDGLGSLRTRLDVYQATQYSIDQDDGAAYASWVRGHQPFHWFVEFYGIMSKGGFDVVVGNPPYVEYSKVRREYQLRDFATQSCGNLYAYVIERSDNIMRQGGRFGMIVQLSYSCTDRMEPIQKLCLSRSGGLWLSHFDDRPAKLFDGLEHIRATISLSVRETNDDSGVYSTAYNRWYTESRPQLFDTVTFDSLPDVSAVPSGTVPKIGPRPASAILKRIAKQRPIRNSLVPSGKGAVYFHNAPQYWVRAMNFAPYFWNERDGEQISSHVKTLALPTQEDASTVVAGLNSSVFYWWFLLLSNCRDLSLREIEGFPLGLQHMEKSRRSSWLS